MLTHATRKGVGKAACYLEVNHEYQMSFILVFPEEAFEAGVVAVDTGAACTATTA